MKLKELITLIDDSIEMLDLVTARKLIENNIAVLKENRVKLNKNSWELLDYISKSIESGYQPPSKKELTIINLINTYAKDFDIRGLKLTLKGNEQILMNKVVRDYLNIDAKVLLESMGAISKHGDEKNNNFV